MSCVRPGVELVLTNLFRLISVFIKEDLPTLERPAKATSGNSLAGYWDGFTALFINSADFMIMLL